MLVLLRKSWWNYSIRGVLAILFGLGFWAAALLEPAVTLDVLVVFVGAFFLTEGVFALGAAISHRRQAGWGLLLLEGLAGIGVGTLAFVWTGATALLLVTFIAAWAILIGVLEIGAAIRLRKAIKGEWRLGVSGLLSIALGLLIFFFPGSGALGIMWLIGAYAVTFGSLLTWLGIKARRLQHELEDSPRHEPGPRQTLRPQTGGA